MCHQHSFLRCSTMPALTFGDFLKSFLWGTSFWILPTSSYYPFTLLWRNSQYVPHNVILTPFQLDIYAPESRVFAIHLGYLRGRNHLAQYERMHSRLYFSRLGNVFLQRHPAGANSFHSHKVGQVYYGSRSARWLISEFQSLSYNYAKVSEGEQARRASIRSATTISPRWSLCELGVQIGTPSTLFVS